MNKETKSDKLDAVTGAFGYTGKYIARRLIKQDRQVITLTGHPHRPNPLGAPIQPQPFHFSQPEKLAENLHGVDTFYNTYWIRFEFGDQTFARAVENTRSLFRAAEQAGLRRFVHVSIANPRQGLGLPYYEGKAALEEALQNTSLSHAIIRPTVIFGDEDILINNIAYLLRRFPVFAIPGSGEYRIQPIFVEDMAELCVQAGEDNHNQVLDAAGPEIFTFKELVIFIREAINSRAVLIHFPPSVARWLARIIGWTVGDVMLTENEVKGLMMNLLVSSHLPLGKTKFSQWVREHADSLGMEYASEVGRHYKNSGSP
jgi:uncharacterized protein YbjT (DUF2867 family)